MVGASLVAQDDTQVEKLNTIRIAPSRGDLHAWIAGSGKVESIKTETRVTPADRIGAPKIELPELPKKKRFG